MFIYVYIHSKYVYIYIYITIAYGMYHVYNIRTKSLESCSIYLVFPTQAAAGLADLAFPNRSPRAFPGKNLPNTIRIPEIDEVKFTGNHNEPVNYGIWMVFLTDFLTRPVAGRNYDFL